MDSGAGGFIQEGVPALIENVFYSGARPCCDFYQREREFMHEEILEYLTNYKSPVDSEESVLAWWQGLQGLKPSLDDLTEALEELEDRKLIEKDKMEKDLFIYRTCK